MRSVDEVYTFINIFKIFIRFLLIRTEGSLYNNEISRINGIKQYMETRQKMLRYIFSRRFFIFYVYKMVLRAGGGRGAGASEYSYF